jgi:cysteine-S-conjugate beta-lyase
VTDRTPNLAELRRRTSIKWQAYGPDVLPAWIADMDFAIAPSIHAALEDALARGDLGYPQSYAKSGLDDVFCARMQARYQWQVAPRQVEFFSDVVQVIYLSLLTLTEPGDGIVIQTPIYPPFLSAVAETERRADICPLIQQPSGYQIDFDALHRKIDARTKLLLLCHPHNPTGRAYTRVELQGLAELVLRHNLLVVSDEIHADLMLDARTHIPFASLSEEIAARTITLTSPSKPFNIAGLCLAVAVFGSEELRRQFQRIPAHVRGGRSTLGMVAARAAWTTAQPWLDATLAQLRANRAHLAEYCASHWPQVKHAPPEATFLGWLDFRSLKLGMEPQRFFLDQAKVALGEGPAFGAAGEGFVRVNFATSPAILEEVLARMNVALQAISH